MSAKRMVSKEDVMKALEKFFAPDIQMRVGEQSGEILGYRVISDAGAMFARTHGPLLYRKYDDVLMEGAGLCFEELRDE